MAKKTDTTTLFRIVALLTALALLAAAGLVYLQPSGGGARKFDLGDGIQDPGLSDNHPG